MFNNIKYVDDYQITGKNFATKLYDSRLIALSVKLMHVATGGLGLDRHCLFTVAVELCVGNWDDIIELLFVSVSA